MDFFSDCQTKDQAKDVYRKLSKCFHPDIGGQSALQLELQKQYDNWKPGGKKSQESTYFTAHEYNHNPRVELLEAEITRLKYLLSRRVSSDTAEILNLKYTVQSLKDKIEEKSTSYERQIICWMNERNGWRDKYWERLDKIIELENKVKELEIIKDPDKPNSLWKKIKYVMG